MDRARRVAQASSVAARSTERSRASAILGSLLFLVVAPGTVAGLVPWWLTGWEVRPAPFGLASLRLVGGAFLVLGAAGLLDSFARFALRGLGTPAPVAPPARLVVTGLYRWVRNPMYVSILAAVLGQALLLADARLLAWGFVLWLGFHLFVVGYEEPKLRKTFGEEYDRFRANVPRWVPRHWPWDGGSG